MTQERLNDVAFYNVHQEHLDRLDLPSIVKQFIANNERRIRSCLGNFDSMPFHALHHSLHGSAGLL